MPARLSAWAVYDVFETADGDPIFIGVVTDTQWRAFCEAFKRPDLLADLDLATNPHRVAARERVIPELPTLVQQYSRQDVGAICERGGRARAPATKPEDLLQGPALREPGGIVGVTVP